MAVDDSALWQDSDAEELVLRYIALKRKYELAQEYDHYAELASVSKKETPNLDAKIHTINRKCIKLARHKRLRQSWRKGLSIVMIFLAILLACPTIAFAVSPAFRETVMQFVLEWKQDHVEIGVGEEENNLSKPEIAFYIPTWIPDGFELTEETSNESMSMLYYENGEQYIRFIVQPTTAVTNLDTDTTTFDFSYEINGLEAMVAYEQESKTTKILWHNDTARFTLCSTLQAKDTKRIAESVTFERP